jgi:hypothetical protein
MLEGVLFARIETKYAALVFRGNAMQIFFRVA